MVYRLMEDVFTALYTYSNATDRIEAVVNLNKTERAAGSHSSAVSSGGKRMKVTGSSDKVDSKGAPSRSRPDTLVVVHQATLLIGEDKPAGNMLAALNDIKAYCKSGINRHHYGAVPCLLAYAASGCIISFLLISMDGSVSALTWRMLGAALFAAQRHPHHQSAPLLGSHSGYCVVCHSIQLLSSQCSAVRSPPSCLS